jgi:nitroreductase
MTNAAPDAEALRRGELPVESLILRRWSPRAYDGSAIAERDLATIFEAARWAPSAFNAQPWRFVYARRGDADWERLLSLLIPFNAGWAEKAGALIFICSDSYAPSKGDEPPQVSHTHSFDAGAAWAVMALQAAALGYHAHGMAGVDYARARVELGVPDRFRVEAAAAIGRLGDKAQLPESLQARESPSSRKPLEEIVFRGRFPA